MMHPNLKAHLQILIPTWIQKQMPFPASKNFLRTLTSVLCVDSGYMVHVRMVNIAEMRIQIRPLHLIPDVVCILVMPCHIRSRRLICFDNYWREKYYNMWML